MDARVSPRPVGRKTGQPVIRLSGVVRSHRGCIGQAGEEVNRPGLGN